MADRATSHLTRLCSRPSEVGTLTQTQAIQIRACLHREWHAGTSMFRPPRRGAFQAITERWSVCDPLGLFTTVFHCLYNARRALYVVETTFSSKFESHSLRQISKKTRYLE